MKLYLNSLLRGLAFAAVLSVGTAASAQVVKVNTDAAKKEVNCCKKGAQKACAEGQKAANAAAEQAAKTACDQAARPKRLAKKARKLLAAELQKPKRPHNKTPKPLLPT